MEGAHSTLRTGAEVDCGGTLKGMALRDDFMQDWAQAGDNSTKRGASLNRGLATLESHGVDVTLRRSMLQAGKPDRWRAQFDASRWIDQAFATLDEQAGAATTAAPGAAAE